MAIDDLDDSKLIFPSDGNNKKNKSSTPLLDNFGKDITKMAAAGKIEPAVGRENEVDRIIQILSRKKKNNPVLVGQPGVGKCICSDSMVTIRNDDTGEIITISIENMINTLPEANIVF
jgi:ATP-dependent Clp protease ATP-binding subunit ClpC